MDPLENLSPAQLPAGFFFGATRAGLKPSGGLDLTCAWSSTGMTAAAMFTQNQVVAAPVIVGRELLASGNGTMHAVLVNSGNANCATGAAGIEVCREICAASAPFFGASAETIFPSSTGVIGVPLPGDRVRAALPQLRESMGNTCEHAALFARAIMTTDTRPKLASASLRLDGKEMRLLGFAKGAGMIHPRLALPQAPHATMLVYLFTDLKLSSAEASALLAQAVEPTLNCISIDGDTSTNDTVFLGANGQSGASYSALSTEEQQQFASALRDVCASLAYQVVNDGEGATHIVRIEVLHARSFDQARTIAKAIAHSPLVKTAWAGADPNWGRLICAIGNSAVKIDPTQLTISYGPNAIFAHGQRATNYDPGAVHEYLKQRDYTLSIDLAQGEAQCTFYTCDLTVDYVRINAEYST